MGDDSRFSDLVNEWDEHRRQGKDLPIGELIRRCPPHLVPRLLAEVEKLERMNWLDRSASRHDSEGPAAGRGTLNLRPGDEVIPGYRLERPLGKGGFGEVWEVENMGRRYALKIIDGGPDWAFEQQRASTERAALARIKQVHHPLILHRHMHRHGGSVLAVLTELADASLQEHFDKLRRTRKMLGLCAEALCLLRDAAEALDYLQDHGLMHLDVKPANLLLVRGRCKLGDFGTISAIPVNHQVHNREQQPQHASPRQPGDASERASLGATLFMSLKAFTAKYAPPEAFDSTFSRSFDQYSLALTFCDLVLGFIPFPDNGQRTYQDRMQGKMDLRHLPDALKPALTRALSADPGSRFQSCMEFIEAIHTALAPLVIAHGDRKARARLRDWPMSDEQATQSAIPPCSTHPLRRPWWRWQVRLGGSWVWGVPRLVFAPLRLFDHLGLIGVRWVRSRWEWVGVRLGLLYRLTILLTLAVSIAATVTVSLERIRPLADRGWPGPGKADANPLENGDVPAGEGSIAGQR